MFGHLVALQSITLQICWRELHKAHCAFFATGSWGTFHGALIKLGTVLLTECLWFQHCYGRETASPLCQSFRICSMPELLHTQTIQPACGSCSWNWSQISINEAQILLRKLFFLAKLLNREENTQCLFKSLCLHFLYFSLLLYDNTW